MKVFDEVAQLVEHCSDNAEAIPLKSQFLFSG